ncbi:MAG: peptidase M48 [Nitrospirae bacterium]|nr:MAG: peptidase M48 [Nitrospirota bacterium]
MSEREAQEYARKVAEARAAQKKQIFEGASNVFTSLSDIPYEQELIIGESLALEGFKRYGLPLKDRSLQKYVNLVGNAVALNSPRPEIPYYFVVVDSPLYNAFSCPGGIIFISSTLVKSLHDESELACVLAHEVTHVAHKHALKSLKRAKFFEGVAQITTANMKGEKGRQYREMIGNLQTILFDRGLDKSMEYDADITGMEIAYRTGYDPSGMIRVLRMLQSREAYAQKAGSWFSTHPPVGSRLRKCEAEMVKYPDANSMARVEWRFAKYIR